MSDEANLPFEPEGVHFFDVASRRQMILVGPNQNFAGWLCFRHPGGQWVSLRQATPRDVQLINKAVILAGLGKEIKADLT